ncbi:hypothetical protein D3C83_203470 [compost metagenome]
MASIAEISSEPMPGTRKICSVMMAPPKTTGSWIMVRVTTGISALRTMCLMMTLRSPRPLARAVVT